MDNGLKLLMTQDDLHNLKKMAIILKDYQEKVLKPLRDSFANEARRAINYNHKVDTAIKEGEKILQSIEILLAERM